MKITCYSTNLAAGQHWQPDTAAVQGEDAVHCICLYPDIEKQRFEGFGGAFTEASGSVWNALPAAAQQEFVAAYFGAEGLGYALGRTHMGSCDFALGNYACVNDAANAELDPFDLSRDKANIFPLLAAADRAAGTPMELLLSPWSPPPFMKTNGEQNNGGKLKPEYYARWAACLAKYAAEYRAAGFDVRTMSVQNEPAATQTWDSCIYTAEEEAIFAADYLYPALQKAGVGDIKILVWDHNKELLMARAKGSFADAQKAKYIAGMGFHWYTGDHFEAVALAKEQYPDKAFYFTEGCVEYSRFDGMTDLQKAEMYAHDILGNLNAGINGSLDWNLLLDEKGGPNHAGNYCEAPIMADGKGGIERKGSYYYIGQFSRYIRPGAVRIGLSRWCAELEATAFKNTDGGIAVVLLNRSETPLPACLCGLPGTDGLTVTVQPHSIMTAVVS